MNNILLNNQCKIVNIVWIDRGIILTLIYYICKKYNKLFDRIIIINNLRYCKFLKYLFPKLKFRIFKTDHPKNFYFNIRTIIKKQDIMIDYLNNYDEYIHATKLKIIPWYDMNDVLISYEYKSKDKLNLKPYIIFLDRFKCKRGNYEPNNQLWDLLIENNILYKYRLYNSSINIYYVFNSFIKSNYTNTVNNYEYPKIYYVPINNNIPVDEISAVPEKVKSDEKPSKTSNEIGVNTDAIPEEKREEIKEEPLKTFQIDNKKLIKLITRKLNLINEIFRKDRNLE